ncbi:hypothetical protein [Bradyrhizobium sp.]|uniref:hypothetical protein n=1 Tax=Bradyrhizobium sp. TaxID=376 RepID=UPI00262E3B44|nr:hypothetical protein [Bradyrhizobium sp.]
MIATAVGIFGLEPTCLRAEVMAQAGTGNTIEMVAPKRVAPQEIRDRGTKFRAELDKAFNAFGDSGKAGHANEFTAIAVPYISAGMALEDAEGILSAAGFTAPPRPGAREHQDRDRTDWYAVVAEIPQFAGRVFGPVDVFVMLLPPEQGLAEFAGRRHRMMYYPRR